MYSLISNHVFSQSPIKVVENSEWGIRLFDLNYPCLNDTTKSKCTLFDLFIELEPRYFPPDGNEYFSPKVINNEDYYYNINIESLFGYHLNVEINPNWDTYFELYDLKRKIEIDSNCMDRVQDGYEYICNFIVYPIRIFNLQVSDEITFLVSNGYFEWGPDGSADKIDEWVIYNLKGDYFTSSDLMKFIQLLLRKLNIEETNLEIAIPKLEAKWNTLIEENLMREINQNINNTEFNKFNEFLKN